MTDSSCIFCKVAKHEAAAEIVYEDEAAVAFRDIHPQAPVHLLVIPRKHLAYASDATETEEALLGHLHLVAAQLAQQHQLTAYRVVMNNGAGAGQTVFHIHLHVLGGRPFHWPPG